MRVYLDSCCLCRPFDDQTVDRNRLEAEAVVAILRHVHQGEWSMIASDAISYELECLTDPDKREFAVGFLALSSESITAGQKELDRMSRLGPLGLHPMDALHIACAETGRCDVLLTSDDDVVRKARKHASSLSVRVMNPLDWIREQIDRGDDRNDAQ